MLEGGVTVLFFFFFFLIYLFYFWLCWVFVAARGLSLVEASWATLRCSAWASYCSGFSCCRAQALGFSSCGMRAQ